MRRFLQARPLAVFATAYGASAAIQKGLGFILFMWLAQSLAVAEYARFGLLFALQAGVATLAAAGVTEAVIGLLKGRDTPASRSRLFGSADRVFVIIALCTAAFIGLAIWPLTRYTGSSMSDVAVVVTAGVLSAFFTLRSQFARLDEAHGVSLALSFFPPLAGLAGGFAGFLLGGGVSGFFMGVAVASAACLPLLAAARVGRIGSDGESGDISGILGRIGPFMLIALLGWLSGYGNTYLVQSLFSDTEVARFTFAYTLSSLLHLLATSLNQVWSPRVFRIVHELPLMEVERRNRRFFALQGAVLGSFGFILLMLMPIAIQLSGDRLSAYRGLTDELFFLLAAYVFAIPWYHAQNFYYAHSKGRLLMDVTILTSTAGVLLWMLSAWVLGPLGAYVGFMLMMLSRSMGVLLRARREWGIGIAWEGSAIGTALLVAAAILTRAVSPEAS